MKTFDNAIYLVVFLVMCLISSCGDNDTDQAPASTPVLPTSPYGIIGSELLKDGNPISVRGVNALQTFGLADPALMNEWNIEIVREFIGNLGEQPIEGGAMQGSDGVWYHSLQNIVNQNRANGKITILCPFGWVDDTGQRTLFTGLNPRSQAFYDEYKVKMNAFAEHFKNQPDVWIEVWNEPYHWNNEKDYNHDLWLADLTDMVDNLRKVEGFENIILVPGNEQGQSEDAIIEKGKDLLNGRYNLLFDLHAYEKWLNGTNQAQLINRIQAIQNNGFAFIFGEVGVENVGDLMQVNHFLDASDATNSSVLAWVWNQNSEDKNALLSDDGTPNDNNNNDWGSQFQLFLEE